MLAVGLWLLMVVVEVVMTMMGMAIGYRRKANVSTRAHEEDHSEHVRNLGGSAALGARLPSLVRNCAPIGQIEGSCRGRAQSGLRRVEVEEASPLLRVPKPVLVHRVSLQASPTFRAMCVKVPPSRNCRMPVLGSPPAPAVSVNESWWKAACRQHI